MLDYHAVKAYDSGEIEVSYRAEDSILYALAVGMADDPLHPQALRYAYERHQLTLPSMACVLAQPGFWMRDRTELGIDALRLVHGEQRARFHAPLPPSGRVTGRTRVTHVVDKGAGKGALLYLEKTVRDAANGTLLATVQPIVFCRGDGGFSEQHGQTDTPPAGLPGTPDGPPDQALELPVRQDAALLYRLCGDMNPLHADPDIARRAGFERPILHGLATYGIACRGLLQLYCGYDPDRLTALDARMSAPAYPGERLLLQCWRQPTRVAFRVMAPARNVVVLSHGTAAIHLLD